MRRDDDFIREMLFEAEAATPPGLLLWEGVSMSEDEHKRRYHAALLCDAGLMVQSGDHAFRLTNQGHDHLEAIRDPGLWAKTKDAIAETGGNATLEIMKDLAVGFLRKKIQQNTGIEM